MRDTNFNNFAIFEDVAVAAATVAALTTRTTTTAATIKQENEKPTNENRNKTIRKAVTTTTTKMPAINKTSNNNNCRSSNSSEQVQTTITTTTTTKAHNQLNLRTTTTAATATAAAIDETATTTTTTTISKQRDMRAKSLTTTTAAAAQTPQEMLHIMTTTATSPTTTTVTSGKHNYQPLSSTLRKTHSTPAIKIADVTFANNNNNNSKCLAAHNVAVPSPPQVIERAMEAVFALDNNNDKQQQQHQLMLASSEFVVADAVVDPTQRFGCTHYKRRAMFVTPCCNKFYKCRFCHDENETHHFDRKTLTELICSDCNMRQKVQESCENCGVRFGKYTCLICNLFDDADKKQYHCHGCGICRIGGVENFFHCEVCDMCLPIRLKIDGHRCVENASRSNCPVCLGDIHTSRIPCHIPDCGHLLHKECFDQLLNSGHYACPTCQTSLIDMTALWDYLDVQALRMPIPKAYENQRIHIFCNDCHKTSKTKFHFIGLKCMHCGAYNTTQDVKRRMSLVADEPTSA